MCCNNRRQARLNGYGRQQYDAVHNISAVIGILQQLRLGSTQQQTRSLDATMPESFEQGQTRGIAYSSITNEKAQEACLDRAPEYAELPSYEDSTRPTPVVSAAIPITRNAAQQTNRPQPMNTGAVRPTSNTELIVSSLEQFNSGLQMYRRGKCGGRGTAKRAARAFVRDMFEQELEKRKGSKGYLEFGERKQIRRELKPLKQIMKDAVHEAREDRRNAW